MVVVGDGRQFFDSDAGGSVAALEATAPMKLTTKWPKEGSKERLGPENLRVLADLLARPRVAQGLVLLQLR